MIIKWLNSAFFNYIHSSFLCFYFSVDDSALMLLPFSSLKSLSFVEGSFGLLISLLRKLHSLTVVWISQDSAVLKGVVLQLKDQWFRVFLLKPGTTIAHIYYRKSHWPLITCSDTKRGHLYLDWILTLSCSFHSVYIVSSVALSELNT